MRANNQIEFYPIKGFEGLYSISKSGIIYNDQKSSILNHHLSGVKRRNYPQVTLYKKVDGVIQKHTKRVHSLMAITFLNHSYGNRKLVVDHIDNNPLNNRLENLQVVDIRMNNIKDRKK
jgi:hypothetical protein